MQQVLLHPLFMSSVECYFNSQSRDLTCTTYLLTVIATLDQPCGFSPHLNWMIVVIVGTSGLLMWYDFYLILKR